MGKKNSKVITLGVLEKMLKSKNIKYQKDGQRLITASAKKTTKEGYDELKLTLEKLESGTIIGCVRGFGKNLGRVTPDMAITAYSSRLDLL